MADREYIIRYVVDATAANSGIDAIIGKLLALEPVIDRVNGKLKTFGTGSAQHVDLLASSLGKAVAGFKQIDSAATTSASSLTSAGTAAKTTHQQIDALDTSARALGRRARTGARGVDAFRDSITSAGAAATRAQGSLGGLQTIFSGLGIGVRGVREDTDGLTLSFGRLLGAGLALRGVTAAVGAVGEAVKTAREFRQDTGEKRAQQRHKARELANLMGKPEVDDQVMARVYTTALGSGLSFDEAVKFLEQAEGSVPAGIQKGNIREEQKAAVFAEIAKTTQRVGLDAATGGDVAGVIAQHTNLNAQTDDKGKLMSAEEAAAGQVEAMIYGANEGRGKLTPLLRAEIAESMSAVASGRVSGLPEMGAFVGVASTVSKSAGYAGTKFKQMDALLNRVGKKESAFLQMSGVAEAEGDYNKLVALQKHLDKVKPKDVDAYLAEQGFGNREERRATVGFLQNLDILQKRREKAAAVAKNGRGAREKNKNYMASIEAQDAISRTRVEAAESIEGKRNEALTIARRNAAARLTEQGLINREDQAISAAFLGGFGVAEWAGLVPETQRQIDAEVIRSLEPAAQSAGIDLAAEGIIEESAKDEEGHTQQRFVRGHNPADVINDLRARGVNVFGSGGAIETKIKADDRSDELKQKWEDAKKPRPPGAPPAAPPAGQPPAGPLAGAGFGGGGMHGMIAAAAMGAMSDAAAESGGDVDVGRADHFAQHVLSPDDLERVRRNGRGRGPVSPAAQAVIDRFVGSHEVAAGDLPPALEDVDSVAAGPIDAGASGGIAPPPPIASSAGASGGGGANNELASAARDLKEAARDLKTAAQQRAGSGGGGGRTVRYDLPDLSNHAEPYRPG